jgi:hypothetical protein
MKINKINTESYSHDATCSVLVMVAQSTQNVNLA